MQPSKPIRIAILLTTLVVSGGCGGAAAGGQQTHAQGHGSGHSHATPEDLRPLMHDLREWLIALRAALDAGDVGGAAGHARAIAVACDDQDVHHVDPERFGPRFAEIDVELHTAAQRLAELADSGDLDAAYEGYGALHRACVSCHEQAPSAERVDISELAPEDFGGPE